MQLPFRLEGRSLHEQAGGVPGAGKQVLAWDGRDDMGRSLSFQHGLCTRNEGLGEGVNAVTITVFEVIEGICPCGSCPGE